MVTYTKHRHIISKKWLWLQKFKTGIKLLLPVLLILGMLPELSAQITVDGNPSDWPASLNNPSYVSVFTRDSANAEANTDNQFTGGSQDPDLLSEWAWSLGGANDKGDISNAGAVMIGSKIYFFGDRTALNGDAAIGFWFFKNNVTMTGTTGGGFTGTHALGDVLVLSHFTNGGGTVSIKVFEWVGSGGSHGSLDSLSASPSTNFARVNTTNYPVPVFPNWAYAPKVGNAGTYYIGSFFEGVIDLASLNLDPCFTKFLLETRNSQSVNASLQDLTFGGFETKPTVSIAPVTVCSGDDATFTATATGGLAPLQYSFNGGAFTSSNTFTVNDATTPASITVVVKGSNGCLSEPDTAQLAINQPALFSTQPSPQTVCAPDPTSFTVAVGGSPAPTLQWQVSTNSGSTWTNLANGGVYSGVTTNTLSISNSTGLNGNLYRAVGTNICGSVNSNSALLTVNVGPAITDHPDAATVCAPNSASFTVAASGTPTPTIQWQISTNSGSTWTNLSNGGVYSGVTTTTLNISNTTGLSGNMYRAVVTNTCGSVNSNGALLTVNTSPTTTNPENSTVCAPAGTSFTVTVGGTPTPTVQWQISTNGGSTWTNLANGGVYSGVTTTTLSISNSTGLSGNQYRAVVTNTCGTINSNAATLTVNVAPAITDQPDASTVCSPAGTSFTVAVTGTPTPTVQWQISTNGGSTWTNLANGGVYSGVTTTTLNISNSTGLNGYRYRAVATNTCGTATSDAAILTVNEGPLFTNPEPSTVCAPTGTSFSITASGTPTPTIQWQVSTNGGSTWTNLANGGVYSGVTTTTLNISNSTGLGGNRYRAVITNTCGNVNTGSALLTVNVAPAITNQPDPVTVCAPAPASFTIEASGTPTPTIQWQVSTNGGSTWTNLANGGVYSGVTTTTLSISNSTGLNGNMYRAVATNTCGTATSNSALLTVNVGPAITDNPDNQTVCAGDNVSFCISTSGTPAPTIQWQVNTGSGFTNIPGATGTCLNLTGVTASMSGNQYRAIATSTCGTQTSGIATLTVNTDPTITNPANRTVCAPAGTSFTVTVGGTPTPTVQWQISTNGGSTWTNLANGGVYSGVTTTTLSISNSTGLSGNRYRAVATNTCGTATSAAAILTVNVAPTITTHPAPVTVCAPEPVSFTVAASGTPTPTIQWQVSTNGGSTWTNLVNGGVYSGVTTTTLNISNTTGLNGNRYRAVATNTCGTATSNSALLTVDICDTFCTYTQGAYGNAGGMHCTPDGKMTTAQVIAYSLNNWPGDKIVIGRPANSKSFTIRYDADPGAAYSNADILAIIEVLPGGGPSKVLAGSYNASPITYTSWLRNGRIYNQLLAQTITMGLNIGINTNLKNFILRSDRLLVTAKPTSCNTSSGDIVPCSYKANSLGGAAVIQYLYNYRWNGSAFVLDGTTNKMATVYELFQLASAALGGVPLPSGITLDAISGVEDKINNIFDGCRVFVGYMTLTQYNALIAPCLTTTQAVTSAEAVEVPSDLKVSAYPNPYNSIINFNFTSPVRGKATLEVYDLVGRRIAVVFEGNVDAGMQKAVNYRVNDLQRVPMIYRLTIGDRTSFGKLLPGITD